jgi:hypothetical protein
VFVTLGVVTLPFQEVVGTDVLGVQEVGGICIKYMRMILIIKFFMVVNFDDKNPVKGFNQEQIQIIGIL